jgi:hypothetical protein
MGRAFVDGHFIFGVFRSFPHLCSGAPTCPIYDWLFRKFRKSPA